MARKQFVGSYTPFIKADISLHHKGSCTTMTMVNEKFSHTCFWKILVLYWYNMKGS